MRHPADSERGGTPVAGATDRGVTESADELLLHAG
jgi:hypothetical protein